MTPWTAAHQASLSITISWSLLKLMPVESVMPSSHLLLCHLLLLLPSIFPSIRVFSNELALCIRWPKFYFLSRLQLYNKVLSATVTVLYIRSSDLINLITESLYPFIRLSLFCPPSGLGTHHSIFCFCEVTFFSFFKDATYKWYHALFVFLCLAYCT